MKHREHRYFWSRSAFRLPATWLATAVRWRQGWWISGFCLLLGLLAQRTPLPFRQDGVESLQACALATQLQILLLASAYLLTPWHQALAPTIPLAPAWDRCARWLGVGIGISLHGVLVVGALFLHAMLLDDLRADGPPFAGIGESRSLDSRYAATAVAVISTSLVLLAWCEILVLLRSGFLAVLLLWLGASFAHWEPVESSYQPVFLCLQAALPAVAQVSPSSVLDDGLHAPWMAYSALQVATYLTILSAVGRSPRRLPR